MKNGKRNVYIPRISALIQTIENDNRPHANVKIFDDKFVGLLDSGANVTVMGKDYCSYSPKWGLDISKKRSSVRVADGNQLRSLGTILLPFEYNGKRKYVNVLIVPQIDRKLILGMNLWHAFNINPIVSEISYEKAVDISLKANLTANQRTRLADTLKRYKFADKKELSCTPLIEHKIDVGGATPVKQKQYVASPYVQEQINAEIDRMLELKIIERASCPKWLNPIIAVKKSNGKIRICLDARELNKRTVKHAYPQQNANRILSRLQGAKYLSTIDLSDAYYQIKIAEESRTSFSVSTKGTFRYVRMANGLCPVRNCRRSRWLRPGTKMFPVHG